MVVSKPSVLCVTMLLGGAHVPPFDGDPVSFPWTAGIE